MLGHTLGTTLLGPNSSYPNCNMEPWGGDMDAPTMVNMSSFHPGGANAAMGDGSVRFIKSSIAMQIIWALGSKAGGEVYQRRSVLRATDVALHLLAVRSLGSPGDRHRACRGSGWSGLTKRGSRRGVILSETATQARPGRSRGDEASSSGESPDWRSRRSRRSVREHRRRPRH